MQPWFRLTLFVTIFVNVTGAIIFLPIWTFGRTLLSLPDNVHSLYLFIIVSWILLFGIFYAWMALKRVINKPLIVLSALGKLSFAVMLIFFYLTRDINILGALAGVTDLCFAILFFVALRQSPRQT